MPASQILRNWRAVALFGLTLAMLAGLPAMAGVHVKERTKTYRVQGSTAVELARSMSKRGPYSRAHRARSWATAGRDLKFQIERGMRKGRCRVTDADVRMVITYTMPRLASTARLDRRQRGNWKRMSRLLTKHEQVHGRYYRELAHKTHRALLRLKPAESCRALDRKALKLVKRLSEKDRKRNQRFDRQDRRNYRRMNRLFSNS